MMHRAEPVNERDPDNWDGSADGVAWQRIGPAKGIQGGQVHETC